MKIKFHFSLVLFFTLLNSYAQELRRYMEEEQSWPLQKLYLHTDREFYFIGDTLWFNAYLIGGQSHSFVKGNSNLYVQLINSKGVLIQNEIFPVKEGLCPGYISFSGKEIDEGKYLLRAYTDYLKNLGEEFFFIKNLWISKTKNSFELAQVTTPDEESKKINIEFFPEGGFLLADKINTVAFKAVNDLGEEINVTGRVIDENENPVFAFGATYKGMGRFFILPQKDKEYTIEIDGYPDLKFNLPEITDNGSKLTLISSNKDHINLSIITNQTDIRNPYYIAVFNRGEGLFYITVNPSMFHKTLKINTKQLFSGINRFVLLDHLQNPLSERLVFVDKKDEAKLNLMLNKDEFTTREKVELQIEYRADFRENEIVHLSMAVVNENALNANGVSQNIKSYLLIDSELKGNITSPADFFVDDENLTSIGKLNLLMMTNGWKNYKWNWIKEKDLVVKFKPTLGLNFWGTVKEFSGKKIIDNSEVTLATMNNSGAEMLMTNTDLNGSFNFQNVQFYDTSMVFVQSKNHKNRLRTNLDVEFSFQNPPELNFNELNSLNNFQDIPLSLFRLNYLNEMALVEFYPDRDSRLLKDINVLGIKPEEKDEHTRFYQKPNESLKVDVTHHSYENVIQFLSGRVAGVMVSGNNIIIRGVSSLTGINEPLFILDGIPIDKSTAESIPMSSIDLVEVLKGNNAAMFGMRGANGVISILTKKGGNFVAMQRPIPGTWIKKLKGFAPYRKFYSPKYNTQSVKNPAPDLRTTLYWNPNVELKNGKAKVSFYSCDNLSRYRVLIEGISEKGKICLDEINFEVNKKRK